VLQPPDPARRRPPYAFVSDFFDFSIYVDALEEHIEAWYVERFLTFRATAFSQPGSFFRHFAGLSDEQARETGHQIWREINGPNLRDNISPTRERARLVLTKGPDHRVEQVRLRRL
jgi:type I pantothenate kinase